MKLDVFAMDTYMTVTAYGADDALMTDVENEIRRIESALSVTIPESEIFILNREGTADVSDTTLEIISGALEVCSATDGALDISIYPVVREWGFTTGEYKVPSEERIRELLLHTDFSKFYEDKKIELDFGAVGKGYAADEAVLILEENGIKSALLDFGGNIQALGKKPDGSLWKVGIKNPWDGQVACALSVESKAVVTSGGYERFFEKDGERYIHIFDPATGHPSQSDLESVTIVCESGKYADALSTALFVMGKDKAVSWWKNQMTEKSIPAFDFILITKSGGLIYSEGLSDFIEPIYQFVSIETVSLN